MFEVATACALLLVLLMPEPPLVEIVLVPRYSDSRLLATHREVMRNKRVTDAPAANSHSEP